jgi:hypothetical protein
MRSRGRSWLLTGTTALTMGAGLGVVGAGSPAGAAHPLAGTYEIVTSVTFPSAATYTCELILNAGGKAKIPTGGDCNGVTKGHWSLKGSTVTIKLFHKEDVYVGKVNNAGFSSAFKPGTYSQIDPTATGTWYAKYQS